ncbi:MAG: hypothetical protein WCD18_11120, partial [Thermosynechococcaceae cyanobacterium]
MDNNFLVSRRKFGKILIFSALTTIAGESLEGSFAKGQSSRSRLIYGITTVPGSNKLSLLTLNLQTGKTNTLLSTVPGVTLNPNERVTGFSRLLNQLFVLAITPTIASPKGNRPRLVMFSSTKINTTEIPSLLNMPELSITDSIESIINPNGSELWLLMRKTGQHRHHSTPRLLSYDINTKSSGKRVVSFESIAPSLRVLSFAPNKQQLYGVS